MAYHVPTWKDYNSLRTANGGPCVSIIMPSHRMSHDRQKDAIAYGNELAKVSDLLKRDFPTRNIKDIVDNLAKPNDPDWWEDILDTIMIYANRDGMKVFTIPEVYPGRTVVANNFYTASVLRFLNRSSRYLVVALSENETKLYLGTNEFVELLREEDMPKSVAEVVRESEITLKYKLGRDDSTTDKLKVERFCKILSAHLRAYVQSEHMPIILAGVKPFIATFRNVADLPEILPTSVPGNWEHVTTDIWRTKAWPIVQTELERIIEQRVLAAQTKAAQGKGAYTLKNVSFAACEGRVDTAILPIDRELYGEINRATGDVCIHPTQKDTRDSDLYDEISETVYDKGGAVFFVPAEHIDSPEGILAALRY